MEEDRENDLDSDDLEQELREAQEYLALVSEELETRESALRDLDTNYERMAKEIEDLGLKGNRIRTSIGGMVSGLNHVKHLKKQLGKVDRKRKDAREAVERARERKEIAEEDIKQILEKSV